MKKALKSLLWTGGVLAAGIVAYASCILHAIWMNVNPPRYDR